MTENQPPNGPPNGPDQGPKGWPSPSDSGDSFSAFNNPGSTGNGPTTPPPSSPPPAGSPYDQPTEVGRPGGPYPVANPGNREVLESGHGVRVGARDGGRDRGKRRTALIATGGLVGVLALSGAGYFAYSAFVSSGPQPAEALPANTLGYVSVNLDPSGNQKVEAFKTLRKFPGFTDATDLDEDSDLKKEALKSAGVEGSCDAYDYDEDVKPWLGDRFAAAAVPGEGDEPTPVIVVEVKDADKAEESIDGLVEDCDGDASMKGAWQASGDWMVISETKETTDRVIKDTEEGTLADDDDFKTWTGATGDPGVLTAYAADGAGKALSDALPQMMGDCGYASDSTATDEFDTDEYGTDEYGTGLDADAGLDPCTESGQEAMSKSLDEMGAMAMTVRFNDGGLEVEAASSTEGMPKGVSEDSTGSDLVSSLPEGTTMAAGAGFESGWVQSGLDYVEKIYGAELGIDDAIVQIESESGISVPEDVEKLMGEAAAVSVGDIDYEKVANSDNPADLPVALKIKGDESDVQEVVDKLKQSAADPETADIVVKSKDGYVSVGWDEGYVDELLDEGSLGDTDGYKSVIEDDAGAVFYLNFDELEPTLRDSGAGEQEMENLEVLSAIGMSAWYDDDVAHTKLRVTTD